MHLCLFSEFALYVRTEGQLDMGHFLGRFSDMDNGELLSHSLFLTKNESRVLTIGIETL